MQVMQLQSLCWEDPLGKKTETHYSILAWKINPDGQVWGYSPWGHKRVGHDFVTKQQQSGN